MIHLRSNQRLYISEDMRGYVDKLIDDGTIPYAVDFLQLGFAYAVRERIQPAKEFDRHNITSNTDILGESKLVIEAVANWYAREIDTPIPVDSGDLLQIICNSGVAGGHSLKQRWSSKSKSQVQNDISNLSL